MQCLLYYIRHVMCLYLMYNCARALCAENVRVFANPKGSSGKSQLKFMLNAEHHHHRRQLFDRM